MILPVQNMIFSAFLIVVKLIVLSSCSPTKAGVSKAEPVRALPTTISLPPSSFHCEVKVIGLDSLRSILVIRKMIQQGAALFYSVGIGDTIQARIYPYQRKAVSKDSITELVLEERLKLNSEIPDFIIRQIISGKK